MKQLTAILIGAGGRGTAYSRYMNAMPEKYKLVGVADPIPEKRRVIKEMWNLPEEMCFESWEDILALPKMADIAVIATSDHLHHAPALKAISLGYDLLLEKPVAQTVKECTDIANAAAEKGVSVLVCHVLRYAPFFKKVKSIIESGMLGEIVSVDLAEAIGSIHFSHSFVRGNWHSEKEATPLILAKTCHDLDMIQWLIDKPCKKVASFGSLTHFTEKNAPEGAPHRCIDGNCPHAETCPYNSERLYIEGVKNFPWKDIFKKQVATHPDFTDEELREAAESAQANKFVSSFTDGYDSMLERGGRNVSGGQRQRLCIARTLLKKPKIIILDDSTSAVDTATEAQIRRAFREELNDSTKIIIAQRIGSVMDADSIIVMNEGRIVGVGKHDDLLANCPEYQEIYESQADMRKKEGV